MPFSHLRDPNHYRKQAARFLRMADSSSDSPPLRDSYLALAIGYERLADILGKFAPSTPRLAATKTDLSGITAYFGSRFGSHEEHGHDTDRTLPRNSRRASATSRRSSLRSGRD